MGRVISGCVHWKPGRANLKASSICCCCTPVDTKLFPVNWFIQATVSGSLCVHLTMSLVPDWFEIPPQPVSEASDVSALLVRFKPFTSFNFNRKDKYLLFCHKQ